MYLASLPMYDVPFVRPHVDMLWQGLAKALKQAGVQGVPAGLERSRDMYAQWSDPRLLLSQSCGYPLTHEFKDKLRYLATPCYDAPFCEGSDYTSLIVVRQDSVFSVFSDLRGTVAGVNNPDSHSGMNILRYMAAPLSESGRFFSRVVETGAQLASLESIQKKEIDVAAVDTVSFALCRKHDPARVDGLRILCAGPPAPALPFVTSAVTDKETVSRIRDALLSIVVDPALAECRAALLLQDIEILDSGCYAVIPAMAEQAKNYGYARLC